MKARAVIVGFLVIAASGFAAACSSHPIAPPLRSSAKWPTPAPVAVQRLSVSPPVTGGPQVWTGRELILFGSKGYLARTRFTNVGVAYDIATNRWHDIARFPIAEGLVDVRAVWNGREVVVIGIRCDLAPDQFDVDYPPDCKPGTLASAAYDPAKDRWRRLSNPAHASEVTNEGDPHALGNVDGIALFRLLVRRVVGFDSVRSRWIDYGDPGFTPYERSCVADHSIVMWDTQPRPWKLRALDVRAARWRNYSLPADMRPEQVPAIACIGDELFVSAATMREFRILSLPTGRWRTAARPPVDGPYYSPTLMWTGSALWLWDGSRKGVQPWGVVYDPARDVWRVMTTLPTWYPGIWAGDRALGWSAGPTNHLTLYEWNA